jgi:GNAT superfamily N-acetyltransferase
MLTFFIIERVGVIEVLMSLDGKKIGIATLINTSDTLHLKWIEVKDRYKGHGYGRTLLDYIARNILDPDKNFHISVTDEQTLPFYYNFFDSLGIPKEKYFTWVQDGDIHPEIVVANGILLKKISNGGHSAPSKKKRQL